MMNQFIGIFLTAFYRGGGCNGFFGFGRGFHGGGWIMGLIGLAVLGVILFFILKSTGSFGKKADSPLEQLKRRYVNGEISKEEFVEKKDFLNTL